MRIVPLHLPRISRNLWHELTCSWAIALVMCGQMTAWAIRGYTPFEKSVVFPAIPILAGIGLLIRSHWLFRARVAGNISLVTAPLFIVFVPFALMSLVDLQINSESLAYMSCLSVLTMCVALNRQEDFHRLPTALLVLGTIGCITPIVELFTSQHAFVGRISVSGASNPLAAATNGSITFCSAMVVGLWSGRNSAWVGVLSAIAIFLGVSTVVLSGTRSTMLGLPLCIVLFLALRTLSARKTTGNSPALRRNIAFLLTVVAAGVIIPCIIASTIDPRILSVVMDTVGRRTFSILGVMSSGPRESSLSMHSLGLEYNWNNLTPWGHGVNAQSEHQGYGNYAHNIYLQAFFDLGIIGGLTLIIVAIVIPVSLILLRLLFVPLSAAEGLITLLFMATVLEQMAHGTPYSWTLWTPTLLVYTLFIPRTGLPIFRRRSAW